MSRSSTQFTRCVAKPCPLPLLRRPAAELDQTVLSGRRVTNCANRSPPKEAEVPRRVRYKAAIRAEI